MNSYEFRLRFSVPKEGVFADLEEALMDNENLDDSVFGEENSGVLGIDFRRLANSADEAIKNAIRDVKTSITESRFLEAQPDLVGVSDMAAYLKFSRQNMRKLTLKDGFPDPIHDGKSAIWNFCVVIDWLENETNIGIPPHLKEVTIAAQNENQSKRTKDLSAIIKTTPVAGSEGGHPPHDWPKDQIASQSRSHEQPLVCANSYDDYLCFH